MSFPELPTIKRRLPPRQLASFPAIGPLGLVTRLWLWWLRRHLNRARYKITLQGRKPRRGTPRRLRADVSRKWASRLGVYIDDKMESKLNEYSRAVGRHDERRHLAAERKEGEKMADLLTAERGLVKAHESAQAHLIDQVAKTRRKAETLRDQLAAGELVRHRDHKSNAAIDRIWSELNGSEWNADTLDRIAAHVRALGYEIGEPGEPVTAAGEADPIARPWGPMKGGQ